MLRSYNVWGKDSTGKAVELYIDSYEEATAWKAVMDNDVVSGKMWEVTYGADELIAQW